VNGGAWPLLVGGATCLVNSANEREPGFLIGRDSFILGRYGASATGRPSCLGRTSDGSGLSQYWKLRRKGWGKPWQVRRYALARESVALLRRTVRASLTHGGVGR